MIRIVCHKQRPNLRLSFVRENDKKARIKWRDCCAAYRDVWPLIIVSSKPCKALLVDKQYSNRSNISVVF